jgi:hypothetical protein
MRHVLFLLALALPCCADVPDEQSAEDFPELALANCPQGRCKAVRAHEALPLINAERASLEPAIRDGYFATPTAEIGNTPGEDNPYQWFAGPAGRGAIYVVRAGAVDTTLGVFHIYGSILEEWARQDYERGLGYFTDPQPKGEDVRQVFEVTFGFTPSIANGGLLRTRAALVARPGGTVLRDEQGEYLNSGNPTVPALTPQTCRVNAWTYLGATADTHHIHEEISLDGYTGPTCENCIYSLSCGGPEFPPYDGSPDV